MTFYLLLSISRKINDHNLFQLVLQLRLGTLGKLNPFRSG